MTSFRRLMADRRSTAALEFALIGLPFILLLLGLVEFGRGLHIRTALDAAADRAQRTIMIDPAATASAVEASIRDTFDAGSSDRLSIAYATDSSGGTEYRLVLLVYRLQLLLPTPVGRVVTIRTTRRIFTS